MEIWQALIFGLVQGLTEFIPISSTAQIIITGYILDIHFAGLAFEILLHLASVIAVTFYFRRELWHLILGFLDYLMTRNTDNRPAFFFGLYIVVATFITGFLGILIMKVAGDAIKSPVMVGGGLCLTAALLVFIERIHTIGHRRDAQMRFSDSIWVGLGQTLAVIPGISRSGSTLIAALWIGLNRETAVRYSFLLAIPVILGSSVLGFRGMQQGVLDGISPIALGVAFFASLIASWISIRWLINFLNKGRLIYFAAYCLVMGLFVIFTFDPGAVLTLD